MFKVQILNKYLFYILNKIMGNAHYNSIQSLLKNQHTKIQNYYDKKFGSVGLIRKTQFPFNYMMLYKSKIREQQINPQIVAYIQVLNKLKEVNIANIAKLFDFKVEYNKSICGNNEISTITFLQDYFPFSLGDFIKNCKQNNELIQQKFIWYIIKSIIAQYIFSRNNKIDFFCLKEQIFFSIQGSLIFYPNFYYNDEVLVVKIQNKQMQYLRKIYNNFKLQLVKIIMNLIFLSEQHQKLISSLSNYTQVDLIKNINNLIKQINYSDQLKGFLTYLINKLVVDWQTILQKLNHNTNIQIAQFVLINKYHYQWIQFQTQKLQKQNIKTQSSKPTQKSLPPRFNQKLYKSTYHFPDLKFNKQQPTFTHKNLLYQSTVIIKRSSQKHFN